MTPLWLAVALAGGDTVTLRGVATCPGAGELTFELLLVGERGPPLLAWSGRVERPGPFALEVPANLGPVRLRVAADQRRDGVGADDPQVLLPDLLDIGGEDIAGLELTLTRPDSRRAP